MKTKISKSGILNEWMLEYRLKMDLSKKVIANENILDWTMNSKELKNYKI